MTHSAFLLSVWLESHILSFTPAPSSEGHHKTHQVTFSVPTACGPGIVCPWANPNRFFLYQIIPLSQKEQIHLFWSQV